MALSKPLPKPQKFKSEKAADKALKEICEPRLMEELILFDTTLHLFANDGLTSLEREKLLNSYVTELERKQYLMMTVIPSKGKYKGMRMLMRALRKSDQHKILSVLEEIYEKEVDAIIGGKVGRSDSTTAMLYRDGGRRSKKRGKSASPNSSSSDDDVILLDSPVEEEQPKVPNDVSPNVLGEELLQTDNGDLSVQQSESTIVITIRRRANDLSKNSNQVIPVTTEGVPSEIKLVFVGDASTGKTSLLERYVNKRFSNTLNATLHIDFKSTELTYQGTKYKLLLWDTAGQERFKAISKTYYRNAFGAFVVYDVTQEDSLKHCQQWKREIDDAAEFPIPVILIANKIDCGQLDGEEFSKRHNFTGYFETSALNGKGIEEALNFMVKKVHELTHERQQALRRDRTVSIKLHSPHSVHSKRRYCAC